MADAEVGLREVVLLAARAVVIVAIAAIVTWLLPEAGRDIVFRTPLLILVLLVGTAAMLWRISRPRPPVG